MNKIIVKLLGAFFPGIAESHQWIPSEDLPGQRYPIPPGWEPHPGAVFFTLSQNGPVLYPFASVGDIAGVPVPHGPRNEFPLGCYALADLDGRVAFCGPWEPELKAHMLEHIAHLRGEAQTEHANRVFH
jgi:hypothetical protein